MFVVCVCACVCFCSVCVCMFVVRVWVCAYLGVEKEAAGPGHLGYRGPGDRHGNCLTDHAVALDLWLLPSPPYSVLLSAQCIEAQTHTCVMCNVFLYLAPVSAAEGRKAGVRTLNTEH